MTGLLEPSFVSAMLPLTLPADFGSSTTLKFTLCPGVKVRGRVKPLAANPAPFTVI